MMVTLRVWSFPAVWWKATSKSILECPALWWISYLFSLDVFFTYRLQDIKGEQN